MRKKYHSTVPELPLGEVNIIPIVDVSFCLVIFCLVAMNIMLTAGINVVHARAGAPAGRASVSENILVTLTPDNRILVNDSETSAGELSGRLVALLPATRDKMVMVRAQDTTRCEQVVDVLDTAKKSGALRLVLMNNPPEQPKIEAPRPAAKKAARAKKTVRRQRRA